MKNKSRQFKKISFAFILILLLTIVIIAAESIDEETSAIEEIQTSETQENANVPMDNSGATNNDKNIETPTEPPTEISIEIPSGIQTNETSSETTNNSDAETINNDTEIINLCENVICKDSNLECPDGFNSTCENSCTPETGDCTSCSLSCEGHEISDMKNNKTVAEKNETSETRIIGEVIDEIPEELNIEIFHSDKIIRGENFEIKAVIANSGIKVKNIEVKWILPENFEIVYLNKKSCGDLNTGESCEIIINAKAPFSTSLGKGEIKATVSYEV